MTITKPLTLYSTMSRKKETFKPIKEGKVGMYVCGVTVYDYCHIGHGRTFVAFDVIRRWLMERGNEVTFVRNVTDVDDKIIRRAAEKGISTKELTDFYTKAMQEDMESLGCLPPTYEPHATDFIPQMLGIIGKLVDKGYAYVGGDGDVDYAVRKFPAYGKLSGKSIDDPARVLMSRKGSVILSTLCSGRKRSRVSRSGKAAGVPAVRAGISSAQP